MSYVILEAGSWELANGTKLQVGKMNTDATVGKLLPSSTWADVTFSDALPFTSAPVVLSQVQTNNDTEWVKTRQQNVTAAGFDVALEEAEYRDSAHGSEEVIGWLAIEGGTSTWNGHAYEAGQTGGVTDAWYSISFGQSFGQAPRFVASLATHAGGDHAALRYQNLGPASVQVKVEEDTTLDTETSHMTETVHYLAIEGDGALTGEAPATESKYYYFNGQRIAMRRDGVLYYTVGDHLGTTSLVLGIDGQGNAYKVAESRHYPYGEERWSWTLEGTFTTDYRFTGQRLDGYIKLYLMGARWYDSELGRWISPDTIIPDPANPQSFNRYSYVINNPIQYIDPSGHWYCGDQYDGACAETITEKVLVLMLDVDDYINRNPKNPYTKAELNTSNKLYAFKPVKGRSRCEGSLSECHARGEMKDFSTVPTISEAEFNELLETVAGEMNSFWTPGMWGVDSGNELNLLAAIPGRLANRQAYDTPFYNGGGKGYPGDYPSDQQVCIAGLGCSGRSEVNYFAQGMWAAAGKDSLEDAINTAILWHLDQYGTMPSEGKLYWTTFGYLWYLEWIEEQEQ